MKIKYFDNKISKNLLNIYKHRFMASISLSFYGAFGIFFLYKILGDSLQNLALLYLISSVGYILLMPFLAKVINKIGFNKIIILGWVINISTMVIYILLDNFKNYDFLISILIILSIFFRLTYWIPYHTLVAENSSSKNRSRVISLFNSISGIVSIIMPVVSGYIAFKFGYSWLFFTGLIFAFIAIYPLFKLDESGEKITWSYKKFFRKFINPEDKKFTLAVFARGLETSVGIVVWPIFILQLLDGNLLKIGFLASLITLFVVILNLIQGKFLDKKDFKKKFIKYGSLLYGIGWFLKIFASTAFYVFVIDVYHKVTSVFSFTPFDALVYDHIADKGHLLDENTILKEMTLHAGKVIGFLIIAILSTIVDLNILFVIAIFGTLMLSLIPNVNIEEI